MTTIDERDLLAAQLEHLQDEIRRLNDRGMGTGPAVRITETRIRALAHCSNPLCEGNRQEEVDAIAQLVEETYGMRDRQPSMGAPDLTSPLVNLVENSHEMLRFAREEDAPCPVCSGPRELTRQVRPRYERLSDVAPDKLLQFRRQGLSSADVLAQAAEKSDEVAELRGKVDALTALLSAFQQGQQPPVIPTGYGSMDMETFEQLTGAGQETLPEGVRRRGQVFECLWRADGKQRSKSGFSTPGEAAEYRTQQLESE